MAEAILGVIGGLSGIGGSILSVFESIGNDIVSFINTAMEVIASALRELYSGVKTAFSKIIDILNNAFNTIVSSASELLSRAYGNVQQWAMKVVDMLKGIAPAEVGIGVIFAGFGNTIGRGFQSLGTMMAGMLRSMGDVAKSMVYNFVSYVKEAIIRIADIVKNLSTQMFMYARDIYRHALNMGADIVRSMGDDPEKFIRYVINFSVIFGR
ncbi:MAG: hypothetical protein GXO43_02180 [Crenarchaeota archaeon]|nr:hypothetical protein [Thermoproteota archaeon]